MADVAVGQVYMTAFWSGRIETLKAVKTPRGLRVICVQHSQWPKLSTRCFSLSMRQLKQRVQDGAWVLDRVASDPALQVSEGL